MNEEDSSKQDHETLMRATGNASARWEIENTEDHRF
jgi:hypothetical protein